MDRESAVAGRFYPATATEIESSLEELFSKAKERRGSDVRALIAPHAGYLFSGKVAASAYNQIERGGVFERVFVLSSAHSHHFRGASLYSAGNYIMPYGEVEVDRGLANLLHREYPHLFSTNPKDHKGDHTIEVQLPFLHRHLAKGWLLVPILLGEVSLGEIEQVAKALHPYFNSENLFVISSDLSHYPLYQDANRVDIETLDSIVSNDIENFLLTLDGYSKRGVENLQTPICGRDALLTLMTLTANNPFYSYTKVDYENSGDHPQYGQKESVVGYGAITISYWGELLFKIAHHTIANAIESEELHPSPSLVESWVNSYIEEEGVEEVPLVVKEKLGVFVTLKIEGTLRGCVGFTQSNTPLYIEVANAALLAAFGDWRFPKLSKEELPQIEIEISVLSPMKKIESVNEIELGRDGILIKGEGRSGLFLPQVAIETGWSVEEFLGHCSRDKAGLGWEGWKKGELFTFTVTII
ncbi:MAG: AmmeMemoRadiSam system protein B [Bacteroidales bacterium]